MGFYALYNEIMYLFCLNIGTLILVYITKHYVASSKLFSVLGTCLYRIQWLELDIED